MCRGYKCQKHHFPGSEAVGSQQSSPGGMLWQRRCYSPLTSSSFSIPEKINKHIEVIKGRGRGVFINLEIVSDWNEICLIFYVLSILEGLWLNKAQNHFCTLETICCGDFNRITQSSPADSFASKCYWKYRCSNSYSSAHFKGTLHGLNKWKLAFLGGILLGSCWTKGDLSRNLNDDIRS